MIAATAGTAGGPLDGHLLHLVPLLVPVVAVAVILLPDILRNRWRALGSGGTTSRSSLLRPGACFAAGLGSLTAGLVHLVVMPDHFGQSAAYGAFFLLAAAGQVAYAVVLLVAPSPFLLLAGLASNAVIVALWATTRTSGVPLGADRGTVEPVGGLDLVATVAELTVVVATALLMRHEAGRDAGHAPPRAGMPMRSLPRSGAF